MIFIGGIIGFLSAIFKDYLLEGKKERIKQKNLKREKIEEAFILLNNMFTQNIMPINYRKNNNYNAKLAMIIRLYFPNIEKDYQKFTTIYHEVYMSHVDNKAPENIKEFHE